MELLKGAFQNQERYVMSNMFNNSGQDVEVFIFYFSNKKMLKFDLIFYTLTL